MSQRALSDDQFEGHLYHATPVANLESIQTKGLQARSPSEGQREGVYGFHRLDHAAGYGGRKKAIVEFKPTKIMRQSNGYSISEAVPPENIVKIHGPF